VQFEIWLADWLNDVHVVYDVGVGGAGGGDGMGDGGGGFANVMMYADVPLQDTSVSSSWMHCCFIVICTGWLSGFSYMSIMLHGAQSK